MKKLSLLFLGIVYYFLIQVTITNINDKTQKSPIFTFTIHSHIPQTVKLHVGAGKNYLRSIHCNRQNISFPDREWLWFETIGEQVFFKLKRGTNSCTVRTQDTKYAYIPIVKQKLTFLNYCILFIFIGIPLFQLLFDFFITILHKIKPKVPTTSLDHSTHHTSSIYLLAILFLGIIIRVLYFQKFNIMHFQHDWQGHIEFIKYMANHWSFPSPSRGLEYPQQPLYYLITGFIYIFSIQFGFNDMQALYHIGYFSIFCSIFFLYYSYKFFLLMTKNHWVQIVSMLFLALTPSIIYLSARINNDVLVMALSSFSLYYIVKSYISHFEIHFYKALLGVSLLFMTKISAAPLELLFFTLLILVYINVKDKNNDIVSLHLQKKLYIFSIVGVFLLGFTLLRVYLPIENTFYMVNATANYPGQMIHSLGWSYFSTFNIDTLITKGYAYIFGEDSIRYSFMTYQYGTMFFGEFKYDSYMQYYAIFKPIIQAILLFGLIYVLGFISYIVRLYFTSTLHKLIFVTLILNLLLILKFIFTYPVICNTDFRYFVSSFVLFAFIFAQGLSYLIYNNQWVKYILSVIIGLLAVNEVIFFILLLLPH